VRVSSDAEKTKPKSFSIYPDKKNPELCFHEMFKADKRRRKQPILATDPYYAQCRAKRRNSKEIEEKKPISYHYEYERGPMGHNLVGTLFAAFCTR
jgi:hypothetical protein